MAAVHSVPFGQLEPERGNICAGQNDERARSGAWGLADSLGVLPLDHKLRGFA